MRAGAVVTRGRAWIGRGSGRSGHLGSGDVPRRLSCLMWIVRECASEEEGGSRDKLPLLTSAVWCEAGPFKLNDHPVSSKNKCGQNMPPPVSVFRDVEGC